LPVVVDEENGIIDGINRLEIAAEVGLDRVTVMPAVGLTPEEKRELAIALNRHRRHLTAEDKRKAIADALKTDPEQSNRQVAAKVGAHHETVADERKELEGRGEIPHVEKTVGKDKKPRQATKPKSTGENRQLNNSVAPDASSSEQSISDESNGKEPEAPVAALDAIGLPIPDKLADAFAAREGFAEAVSLCRKLSGLLNQLAQAPGGDQLRRDLQCHMSGEKASFRLPALEEATRKLKFAEPYAAACPHCHHKHAGRVDRNCAGCLGTGWVPKLVWEHAPEDYRAAVLAAKGGAK
jgi:transposase-like protein